MKKVISIVLALLMMLPIAAMLIPTASAAEAGVNPGYAQPQFGAAGQTYVELDFDDPELADLVDKDLAAALGWNAPNSYATMLIEKGEDGDNQMRIVTQYSSDGTYPASREVANKWAGSYSTTLASDDDILLNTISIEYKFTYQKRPAGSPDVVTTTKDGKTKTIKADGQGGYQFAGVIFGKALHGQNDQIIGRVNYKGDGYDNTWRWGSGKWNGAEWPGFFAQNYAGIKANPDVPTTSFEYNDDPLAGWKQNADTQEWYFDDTPQVKDVRNITDVEHTFKAIVDPLLGVFRVYVDDVLILNTVYSWTDDWGKLSNNTRAQLYKNINLWVKPGFDFLIDDIKVSQYTPALEVSEAMINGGYQYGKGNYQYVELTNSSEEVVNVYDYALHIYNMCTENSATTATIGGETHQGAGTSAYYGPGVGSFLAYFQPGSKTLANGDVFDSPAYADGTLQPGESAVVLIPDLAMLGNTNAVTDEAFLNYLKGLNPSFNSKIFVADNSSENPCVLAHYSNESFALGVMKAKNNATDGGYEPVAIGAGLNVQQMFNYHESMALMSDKTTGGSALFGGSNWTPASGNWPAGALVGVGSGTTGNKSAEVEYYGMLKAGAYNIMGFGRKVTDERLSADGTSKVTATPGYVPAEYRAEIDLNVTDVDGKTSKVYVPRMTNELKVATPQKKGYTTQVWVDGELKVENAVNESTTFTVDQPFTASYAPHIEVKYYREGPMFIGIQRSEVAEDGTYSIRLLAGVNAVKTDAKYPTFAYDSFGFEIYMDWNGASESKEITYNVGYVYTGVTAYDEEGNPTVVTAEYYGFDYLYAVHINNIPTDADYEDLYMTVKATYSIGGVSKTAPETDEYFDLGLFE